MTRSVRRVVVVGAGVMGAGIAAHLANARFTVSLLDVPSREATASRESRSTDPDPGVSRNRVAQHGIERATRCRPPAFFLPQYAQLIRLGNLEDDLEYLKEADWIIEAVVEDFETKRQLVAVLDQWRGAETIVSSNTSCFSLESLAKGTSQSFRSHWLGTHFFNPPRYTRLLEIITTKKTVLPVVDTVCSIAEKQLGKRVVYSNDTPGFIANRIGVFASQVVLAAMQKHKLSMEEVDLLTGSLIGRAPSATFHSLDLLGLDTYSRICDTIYENALNDEQRARFAVPEFVRTLVERKWLGEKAGQGFYKRTNGQEILSLDLSTLEYRPCRQPFIQLVGTARSKESMGGRLKCLVDSEDEVGKFVWTVLTDPAVYAASLIPEVAEDIISIDNVVKWGLNWELGPFETLDLLGLEYTLDRFEREGNSIPPLLAEAASTEPKSLYTVKGGAKQFFSITACDYREIPGSPGTLWLSSLKLKNRILSTNLSASLIDLGDGVLCVEFHSKMNVLESATLEVINEGLELLERQFEGLVIGNQGSNFSVGANLRLILEAAETCRWEAIESMIRTFQSCNQALKFSSKPVVVAPYGLTLGGGCELMLHARGIQASAETYLGLVEVAVGLIPAGGGCKEMLVRCLASAGRSPKADFASLVQSCFETIALGKVSTSAEEARMLGFISDGDGISMNPDYLLLDAKMRVLQLAKEASRGDRGSTHLLGLGRDTLARLKLDLQLMRQAGKVGEYDLQIGNKLALVLCGGDHAGIREVSEQSVLDLEREVFLSLCGEPQTRARIMHMLEKGKPLRN